MDFLSGLSAQLDVSVKGKWLREHLTQLGVLLYVLRFATIDTQGNLIAWNANLFYQKCMSQAGSIET